MSLGIEAQILAMMSWCPCEFHKPWMADTSGSTCRVLGGAASTGTPWGSASTTGLVWVGAAPRLSLEERPHFPEAWAVVSRKGQPLLGRKEEERWLLWEQFSLSREVR